MFGHSGNSGHIVSLCSSFSRIFIRTFSHLSLRDGSVRGQNVCVMPRNSREINGGILRPLWRFNNEEFRFVIGQCSESYLSRANMETNRGWMRGMEDPLRILSFNLNMPNFVSRCQIQSRVNIIIVLIGITPKTWTLIKEVYSCIMQAHLFRHASIL